MNFQNPDFSFYTQNTPLKEKDKNEEKAKSKIKYKQKQRVKKKENEKEKDKSKIKHKQKQKYKKKLNENKNKMTKILIPEIEPPAFLSVLRFIYLRELVYTKDHVIEILYASDKFGIMELKNFCLAYVQQHFSIKSIFLTLEKAIAYRQHELIKKLMKYLEKKSYTILSQSNCLDELSSQALLIILKSKNLFITEHKLFRLLLSRGKFQCLRNGDKTNKKNLKRYLKRFLPYIHLDLMGIKGLKEISSSGLFDLDVVQNKGLSINEGSEYEDQPPINRGLERSRKTLKKRIKLLKNEIKVVVLSSESREQYKQNVIESIKSRGIQQVDSINVSKKMPTLEHLLNYDSVFLFSCDPFKDPVQMGDILADYVERNRGLVICSIFAMEDNQFGRNIQGRIVTDAFLPMVTGKLISHQECELDQLQIIDHPIMNQVLGYNGGKLSYRINSKIIKSDSKIISRYKDGNILAAEKRKEDDFGIVVVLNIWPISDKISTNGNYWLTSTDGTFLIANAVEYASIV